MDETIHIGRNIRNIRLLLGMKQQTFAKALGIAQQNVSKMENRKRMSPEKQEEAASALGVTIEALKNFNERVLLNNNIALEQNSGQIVHPIKEVMEYFKEELLKRDRKIEELQAELEQYRSGKRKTTKQSGKTAVTKTLRSVDGERQAVQ